MNSSFLPNSKLQFAWDSTSLGVLKECPRKYYYSIVEGWVTRADNIHLAFGIMYHSSLEAYDYAKAKGADHQAALLAAVRRAMVLSWNTETKRPWTTDDKYKNRLTLVRSVVWYLTKFSDDALETVILPDGKPAVELSFRFQSTYNTSSGKPYILCGHLDRIVSFNNFNWIADRKTTKYSLTPDYFSKFSPDNQMSLYSFAGKIVYSQPTAGIIIDAVQVQITQSQFERGFTTRTDSQLDEWYKELGHYLFMADHYAANNYWPHNDKACGMYGGCPYRTICGKDPSVRESWLAASFTKRTWDPLQVRGDI